MAEKKSFFGKLLSATSDVSCKRFVGLVTMAVALGCIIFLTIKEGCSDCVEGLVQTAIITGCSLLGLSSITSIWKNGKISVNDKKEEEKNEL